jgi:hypothetical protein
MCEMPPRGGISQEVRFNTQGAFDRLRAIPERDRHILSCIVGQFDGLSQADRNRLFSPSLPRDVDTPLSPKQLADEFLAEIQERIKTTPADGLDCLDPTPGKIRVYEPVGEDPFTQVRICQVRKPPLMKTNGSANCRGRERSLQSAALWQLEMDARDIDRVYGALEAFGWIDQGFIPAGQALRGSTF